MPVLKLCHPDSQWVSVVKCCQDWQTMGGPIFAISPDGQSIAYLGSEKADDGWAREIDNTLRLWNPWVGRDDSIFKYEEGNTIYALAFDRDGITLGAVGRRDDRDSAFWLWDVTTRQQIMGEEQRNHTNLVTTLEQQNLWWRRTPVESIPDTFEFWLEGDNQTPVFGPDGTLIVSLCEEDACLLDAESGELIQRMESVEGTITSAAFSPDGQLLAATTGGSWYHTPGKLYIWETSSGRLLAAPEGHLGAAWDVAFSPDGTVIASAGGGCYQCEGGWGWDNVIRLWRVIP